MDHLWGGDAVTKALARLAAPHKTKKRNTILALAQARMEGRPDESVWQRPDTCSRVTWHTRWKADPEITAVLMLVMMEVESYLNRQATEALQEAAKELALAAPLAVRKAVEIMTNSQSPHAVLNAAFGILDRAGIETAPKTAVEHSLPEVEEVLGKVWKE